MIDRNGSEFEFSKVCCSSFFSMIEVMMVVMARYSSTDFSIFALASASFSFLEFRKSFSFGRHCRIFSIFW